MSDWETWNSPAIKAELQTTPIVVVMGGDSFEREVSMTSGRSIVAALRDLSGPSADVTPPVTELEISASGQWCLDGLALSPQRAVEALPANAVYILALHGGAGEDGRVQAFLQLAGRRHTGPGTATSSLCMHKHHSRLVASDAGVAVAPGAFATNGAFKLRREDSLARFHAVPGKVKFVKHATAGSSFGVFRCTSDEEVTKAADTIAEDGGDILVETEISGLETTCGVIGTGNSAHALPVVEILPATSTFFDHQQKYAAQGGAVENCPPVYLPSNLAERIKIRARRAWESFNGHGYGRIDFIVPCKTSREGERVFEDDAEPIMLEANTLPGFTPRSLLPLAAKADGVNYRELCLEIVARAL
ncbi:D-alanine--D-alanine ligase Ddl [Planctomycetes bacterium Poly30]|uniref:D-alanine--D-alanine ligase n=1 Tax=Saltatorellus ferox TaxID=2528018 RepID=A0A518ETB9_9BACT|nr:D-alanine--D-alanine ligase Ddl [Planctomycetes bacterium Poly30]